MKCSVTIGDDSDRVKLYLPDAARAQSTMPARSYEDLKARHRENLLNSALQRPELSRAHLAAMLRRALKKQKTPKAQKTYWNAFLSNFCGSNANSNELES